MKKFMDENFLLETETAKKLYNNHAKHASIIDYHCHLNPKEIADNKKYKNITEIWLGGDHYKWRVMRANGVEEKYITGDADDKEKFFKWAETIENCIGNPLYHWTHLELQQFFNIHTPLTLETAEEIWTKTNAMLQTDEFSARSLITRSKVTAVCTTDGPVDSLEEHIRIKNDSTFDVKILPTFRPDGALNLNPTVFLPWLAKLEETSNITIKTYKDYANALVNRMEFFHEVGCRVSDHALDPIVFEACTDEEGETIFKKLLDKKSLSELETNKIRTHIFHTLGKGYNKLGWVMQLHMGCLRDNSTRMLAITGQNTGFDSLDDKNIAEPVAKILDQLDQTDELPKTVLYNLNPKDTAVLAGLMGVFQKDIPGKIQLGSAWWFLDTKDGMEAQIRTYANFGLLPVFIGMLTDSRSFLSYARHDYFRRILCNIIGNFVENGEYPHDMKKLGKIVEDISYNNVNQYIFGK